METVCKENQCVGCMACVDMCPKGAISIVDSLRAYNAVIDKDKCVNCGICTKVCQNNNTIKLHRPQAWYQGWIDDDELRTGSSSGGAAKAISRQFIREGGVVFSCCFRSGAFCFEKAETYEELEKFAGSKYVKSNPTGVYKAIRQLLQKDRKVLFIGLPCQVGGLKTVIGENENLYTVDLICHGTPSPKLIGNFLSLHKIELRNTTDILFRNKDVFGLMTDHCSIAQPGTCDDYMLAFLCGLDFTDNCYQCAYASTRRSSDITIGDSWKSDLPIEEQKRGISLILCNTEKGKKLLKEAQMKLFPVNPEHAISANAQLRGPFGKTKKHDVFFTEYAKHGFRYAAFRALPSKCIKQRIKAILIKTGMLPNGRIGYNAGANKN